MKNVMIILLVGLVGCSEQENKSLVCVSSKDGELFTINEFLSDSTLAEKLYDQTVNKYIQNEREYKIEYYSFSSEESFKKHNEKLGWVYKYTGYPINIYKWNVDGSARDEPYLECNIIESDLYGRCLITEEGMYYFPDCSIVIG